MSSSCPIALIIRRQTVTPALSPSAASSSARLSLSASAVSPYHHSIRQAARQMSISDATGYGYYVRHVDNRLTSTTCSSTKAALVLLWSKRAMAALPSTNSTRGQGEPTATDRLWSR